MCSLHYVVVQCISTLEPLNEKSNNVRLMAAVSF
ncbi:MAG: hypothetical protein QOD39_3285, partial [Mycobacterium sp.]|nr:hypothetical protein [Mycobacterium sp.]